MSDLTDNAAAAENQQETRKAELFYISGFCAGEMSCSVTKQTRPYGSGFSYYPDLTISNADINLLRLVNKILTGNRGVIVSIKGGYNLNIRGRSKVTTALSFFDDYPIIAGDLANTRLALLRNALAVLSAKGNSTRRLAGEVDRIEGIRTKFKEVKLFGKPILRNRQIRRFTRDEIGYFLSGVLDAEGSCGLRKRGATYQAFFAVAMKDKKIPILFQQFAGFGFIYERPRSRIFHFETGDRQHVRQLLNVFQSRYPSRHRGMKARIEKLTRILNDYTHGAVAETIHYNDGSLWRKDSLISPATVRATQI